MIPEAEIRRLAGRWGVDPMIVDLDYVLGCSLASLYGRTEASPLRAKGGTCLRKCYYADYRFSEDLDFTAEQRVSPEELQELLAAATRAAADAWEIDFAVRPIRIDVVGDEYGKESYQARLYYRGPLRRGGDPRAIRLDVTTNEVLALPAARRGILHPYSDGDMLANVRVPCYDLVETLAEKARALAGQRQYAISRDVYDVAELTQRASVDLARVAAAVPAKLEVKGLAASWINVERLRQRRDEFRADWQRNLMHLLPAGVTTDFDGAWERTVDFIADVSEALQAKG